MTIIRAQDRADGIYFGEGPRWHDGALWFSDFFAHAIKRWTADGGTEIVVRLEGDAQPSGLGWSPDGTLHFVSMLDRRLMRWEGSGDPTVVAELADLAPFHCNDMVMAADGTAYVGNFGFDLHTWESERSMKEILRDSPATNLVRVRPDGTADVVAEDLRFPNGMVILGDVLVVAETMGQCLTAFDIAGDGTLSGRRVFADLGRRLPDGICADAEGRIWVADPSSTECVLVAEGGEVVSTVQLSQTPFACMLGGADGRTLHVLTSTESHADRALQACSGKIETAVVDVPHGGRP
ncbi:MAG: SMP-30/gluconolactonase/LRE family protein [Ilumatobacteraceae bacterium]